MNIYAVRCYRRGAVVLAHVVADDEAGALDTRPIHDARADGAVLCTVELHEVGTLLLTERLAPFSDCAAAPQRGGIAATPSTLPRPRLVDEA